MWLHPVVKRVHASIGARFFLFRVRLRRVTLILIGIRLHFGIEKTQEIIDERPAQLRGMLFALVFRPDRGPAAVTAHSRKLFVQLGILRVKLACNLVHELFLEVVVV